MPIHRTFFTKWKSLCIAANIDFGFVNTISTNNNCIINKHYTSIALKVMPSAAYTVAEVRRISCCSRILHLLNNFYDSNKGSNQ